MGRKLKESNPYLKGDYRAALRRNVETSTAIEKRRYLMKFEITPKEMKQINSWLAEHDKECPYTQREKQGAIGGRLTYQFTPTGLGIVTRVICGCGAETDISDYETW